MDINFVDGLTLEKALQIAYSDDLHVRNIYIEAPDASELTDEDSCDEDEGGLVDNLSRNQLMTPAQLEIVQMEVPENNETHIFYSGDDDIGCHEEYGASENTGNISFPQAVKIDYDEIEWVDGDLRATTRDFPEENYESFKTLTPVELFEMFFDDDMISYFVTEPTKYANFKNHPNPQTTNEEMRCFFAIFMLRVSGYNWLPGKKYYWNTDGDMGNQIVIDAMRRDRFLTIWKYQEVYHLGVCQVSDDLIFDHIGHYLIPVPNDRKIKCAGEQCKSIMRTMCIKCNVGLCPKCNLDFATNHRFP